MSEMDKKSYGLLLPKKPKTLQPKAKSVFDSDSDEDEISVRVTKKPSQKSSKVEAKHIEEDPSIYEYDSIYDSMKETQTQKKAASEVKKPRYITSLLKAADKRKKDQERRVEKKIHNERIKEGDEFKDKEAFVTSAYKKKMQEMEAEEEKEKIKEKIDEMMDVTKQKDLSGFYRHLLNQTTGEEKVPEFGDSEKLADNNQSAEPSMRIKLEKLSDHECHSSDTESQKKQAASDKKRNISRRSHQSSDSDEDHSESPEKSSEPTHLKPSKKNFPRRRHDSESTDEEIILQSDSKHKSHSKNEKPLKRKQCSDNEESSPILKSVKYSKDASCSKKQKPHSSESSSSDDENQQSSKANASLKTRPEDTKPCSPVASEQNGNDLDADDDDIVDSDSEKSEADAKKDPDSDTAHQNKMSSKFVKRTVGEVFKQAQERYFRRMAARNESKNA